MSPPRPQGRSISPRQALLDTMRPMKRALDQMIRPLAGTVAQAADAEDSADYWADMWHSAQFLRVQADKLAAHAARLGRLARERAHPANQAPPAATTRSEER